MPCRRCLVTWWLAVLLILAATTSAAADHAVILQYHHVSPAAPASTSVTPEVFAAHLERLHRDGFRVAALPGILEALRRGEDIPDSTVCLTADDGHANLLTHARPLLERYGWTMTVFVCIEQVDRGRPLHLDWDDLRELQAAGWAIASHGLAHEHLVARRSDEDEPAWRARMRKEVGGSLERLRLELGDSVPALFAYPYGEFDLALADVVAELGVVGLGQHSGAVGPTSDWRALPRFPVSGVYGEVADVAFKAATLPLPVVARDLPSPVLSDDILRPRLTLAIIPGDWDSGRLAAYASGQGAIDLTWDDRAGGVVTIQAGAPLPPGRSRYNLTAPHRAGSRWFWFSQPWLRTTSGWQDE